MKNTNFKYGKVLEKESQIFRFELYKELGLKKIFRNKKVLDLGCGYGLDSLNFSKFAKNIVGADSEKHEYWDKIKNKKIKFIQTFAEKLPFKDKEFDAIYLKDLLHHVNNVTKTLKEIKRVSKDNSTIIIVEGNRYNPIFYIYATKIRGHEHFTRDEFRKLIRKHFDNVEFISLESYPPFCLNEFWYRKVIFTQKIVNKFKFLKPLFSYNIAVIRN
jgi:ubiquinone/menaquinone biosynthesis C-methylase UbiE